MSSYGLPSTYEVENRKRPCASHSTCALKYLNLRLSTIGICFQLYAAEKVISLPAYYGDTHQSQGPTLFKIQMPFKKKPEIK